MRVILPTYYSIRWIVPIYERLHSEYWGAPVTLIAESDYSGGRFEFVPPPKGIHSGGEIWSGNFSDVLIWYLYQIEDEHVVIMLADYLLRSKVDTDKLSKLEAYMQSHPNVLRGQVGAGGMDAAKLIETWDGLEIWEGNFLQTSLTPGLWNRKLLLEMMKPGLTSWGVETVGQGIFLQRPWRSVAPSRGRIEDNGIMAYTNAQRGKDIGNVLMTEEQKVKVGHMVPDGIAIHVVQ